MFEESACILCLETIGECTGQINIDSVEARKLNVQQTLDKYFNYELSATLTCATVRILCGKCWNSVFTFHEFCLRVQRAHTAATETLRVSAALTNEQGIKLEVDVGAAEDTAPLAKRHRRRLHEKVVLDTSPTIVVPPECDAKREELNLCPTEPKLQFEQIDLPSTETNTQLDMDNIKHEILQEEPIVTVHSANDASPPKDRLGTGESEVLIIKEQKGAERKSVFSTKESDEFIAKNLVLNCCLCGNLLDTFAELRAHFRIEHQKRWLVRCCGKKISQRALLEDHLHTHQDPDYFKCPKCGKVLLNRSGLEFHLKNHEDARDRNYQCDVCSKSFSHRKTYDRHALTHVPKDQKHYACPQCEKTFADGFTMSQHMRTVHLKIYARICEVCGKTVHGPESLRRHMAEHAAVKSGPVECEVCGVLVSNKYSLISHKKRMHAENSQTPQICSICHKESASALRHYQHMIYMHTLERKHACTICTKAFKNPSELRKHVDTHIGGNVYTCTFCPQTFNSIAPMYIHRRKMHPNEHEELRRSRFKMRKESANNTLKI